MILDINLYRCACATVPGRWQTRRRRLLVNTFEILIRLEFQALGLSMHSILGKASDAVRNCKHQIHHQALRGTTHSRPTGSHGFTILCLRRVLPRHYFITLASTCRWSVSNSTQAVPKRSFLQRTLRSVANMADSSMFDVSDAESDFAPAPVSRLLHHLSFNATQYPRTMY